MILCLDMLVYYLPTCAMHFLNILMQPAPCFLNYVKHSVTSVISFSKSYKAQCNVIFKSGKHSIISFKTMSGTVQYNFTMFSNQCFQYFQNRSKA